MIYLKVKNNHVLVLEPGNIEELRDGGMVRSPNGEVGIIYTPDLVWFKEQQPNLQFGQLDIDLFDKIHKESLKRPEVKDRPYHKRIWGGKVLDGQKRQKGD